MNYSYLLSEKKTHKYLQKKNTYYNKSKCSFGINRKRALKIVVNLTLNKTDILSSKSEHSFLNLEIQQSKTKNILNKIRISSYVCSFSDIFCSGQT